MGHLMKTHRTIFIVMVQQTEPQKVEEEGDARDSEDEQDFWSRASCKRSKKLQEHIAWSMKRFMAAIVMIANQEDCLWVNYIGPCGRRVLQW